MQRLLIIVFMLFALAASGCTTTPERPTEPASTPSGPGAEAYEADTTVADASATETTEAATEASTEASTDTLKAEATLDADADADNDDKARTKAAPRGILAVHNAARKEAVVRQRPIKTTTFGPFNYTLYETKKGRAAIRLFKGGLALMGPNPEEAVKKFNLALLNAPHMTEARYNLALTYLRLKDPRGARTEFLKVIKAGVKNIEVYEALGKTFLAEGKLSEAIKSFSYARSIKERASTLVNMAIIYQMMENPAKAEEYYLRAEDIGKDDPFVAYNYGLLLMDDNRLDEAEPRLRRALTLSEEYPKAFTAYGKLLLKKGLTEEAVAFYTEKLEKYPERAYLYRELGVIHELYMQDFTSALMYYKKYLSMVGAMVEDEEASEVSLWVEIVEELKKRGR